jgi:hypothetical protein
MVRILVRISVLRPCDLEKCKGYITDYLPGDVQVILGSR